MASNTFPDVLNYIAEDDLRESLVADYREMEAAAKSESWKCVLVLAGSMVEALLTDYLLTVKDHGKSETEILSMMLGQIVNLCVTQKLLDPTTEKLCVVIKDYRNLIHPGRIMRLQQPVNAETAEIAMRLVRMVAKGVSKKRQEQYGYTALEVLAKLEGDSKAFTGVLPSLLKKLNEGEQKRLLFRLLPERNYTWRSELEQADEEYAFILFNRIRCAKFCFRSLLNGASQEVMAKHVAKYLSILQTGTEAERTYYERSFVKASDIEVLPTPERTMVIDYMLSLLESADDEVLNCTQGIGRYIENTLGMTRKMDRIIRCVTALHNCDNEMWQHWLIIFGDGLHENAKQYTIQSINTALQGATHRKIIERLRLIKDTLEAEEDIPF